MNDRVDFVNQVNYQKMSDEIIASVQKEGKRPSLLLQCCCAPCSSYVLEYLSKYFDITVFYYNPNISPLEEYEKRFAELKRLTEEMPLPGGVKVYCGAYENERFRVLAKGLEAEPEGGERCQRCYRLRLEETAKLAKEKGFDFFTTTLSISPMKNAEKLNKIGEALAEQYGVQWFYSDFKKREGYKRSIALSKEYHLYRQNYCGCLFSKAEAVRREAEI